MFSVLISPKFVQIALLSGLLFYVTGCGISNRVATPPESPPAQPTPSSDDSESTSSAPVMTDVSSQMKEITSVDRQLQNAHQEWKGTPYIYGGNGSSGIDCSAFTQVVFRDFFDTDLPRNTRSQLQEGSGVRRKSIQTGDLIFFKTGRKSLHVGISMGNGDFLHASQSSGVMISNIGDLYWATRYLGARRVL